MAINLREYKFPKVTGADMAFPTYLAEPELLAEAKERGFYNGRTPYNDLFSTLFYKGGKVKFKENLPDDFKNAAYPYLRAFMGSWGPKHEHKEAIAAMLLSELCEPTTGD